VGIEKYPRRRSTFEAAFRKSGAAALPCLALPCLALPRREASTSLDLPRATRVNAQPEKEALRFTSVTATHVHNAAER